MSKLTGEQIRQGRYTKRMTLRALAKALGVSAPYLSDVEHDRRNLSEENTTKVAELLSIRPRVSTRACVGYGGRFEDAVYDVLFELRENGFFWSSYTVASHTIEPYRGADGTWCHRHRVVLEVTRGAVKT